MITGTIYTLTHNDKIYVGSTINPKKRLSSHRSYFKHKTNTYKYFKIDNFDDIKFDIIKQYDVVDRKHLFAYETLHINKINCVNKMIASNIKTVCYKKYIRPLIKRHCNSCNRSYSDKNFSSHRKTNLHKLNSIKHHLSMNQYYLNSNGIALARSN